MSKKDADKQQIKKKAPKPVGVKPEVKKKIKKQEKKHYTRAMWKGIIEVFKCASCGFQNEDEVMMQLHCLSHVPDHEKEELLSKFSEVKNG